VRSVVHQLHPEKTFMNDNDPSPRFRRSPLAKSDGPIRQPRDPRVTDLSRRVQLIGGSPMTPNVGDDLPKRGKPVAEPFVPSRRTPADRDDLPRRGKTATEPEPSAPPRRPAPEVEDLPRRRASSTASQPPADVLEASHLPPRGRLEVAPPTMTSTDER